MVNVTGEAKETVRVAFDRRLKREFHGAGITSVGGLPACGPGPGNLSGDSLRLTEALPVGIGPRRSRWRRGA